MHDVTHYFKRMYVCMKVVNDGVTLMVHVFSISTLGKKFYCKIGLLDLLKGTCDLLSMLGVLKHTQGVRGWVLNPNF